MLKVNFKALPEGRVPMTYMIRPDDLSEVHIRRYNDEIQFSIVSDNHTWILIVPNGDILEYIAERFIHHHLDTYAEPLEPDF